MDLQAYLDRIGYSGAPRADLATLRELHRLHLYAIPYENLDVQLRRPTTIDPEAAFEKIVRRGRGGWCYEMNGLLGAALTQIGFEVTRMAGSVARGERDRPLGNHLVLRVDLDRPYIADVGFGDGLREPVPLAPGPIRCAGYDFRLEPLDDGWLRFHNHATGGAPFFDFQDAPASPDQLSSTCQWLSTSPESIFVQTAICQRHRPDGIDVLLGRVLRDVTPSGKVDRLLGSADEFVSVLRQVFGLDLPEAGGLWPAICAKHDQLFGEAARA
jgi:N-hydroxyarylamine O-acetyltransferase